MVRSPHWRGPIFASLSQRDSHLTWKGDTMEKSDNELKYQRCCFATNPAFVSRYYIFLQPHWSIASVDWLSSDHTYRLTRVDEQNPYVYWSTEIIHLCKNNYRIIYVLRFFFFLKKKISRVLVFNITKIGTYLFAYTYICLYENLNNYFEIENCIVF